MHPTLTPQAVLAAFHAVDAECLFADAADIADRINANAGDVARAIQSAGWENPSAGKVQGYADVLQQAADPAKLADRLRSDADALQVAGEKARREADEFRAKHARWGDDDYSIRAAACERVAVRNLAEARRLLKRANALDDTPQPPPAATRVARQARPFGVAA